MPMSLKEKMKSLAESALRKKQHLATEALLVARTAQIEGLKAAVAAADQGDFANDEEVRASLTRHA